LYDKYNVRGAAISAVDLIKGIGICAGLDAIDVPGATGTIHTNFEGKASAAIEQFKEGKDFIYLHLEAPDECSHQGDIEGKIKSLELIDEKIVRAYN
jgi:2,3-bisphosphoglycerate-independent phosphoglycerate mutase